MTLAIYPGSFDPFTNGHLDIALRAAKLFDRLIVAVTENVNKQFFFTVRERTELIRGALQECAGELNGSIEVASFQGLLVDEAARRGAGVVVRGLRAVADFEYEFQMALMNRKLRREIEMLYMMPSFRYSFLTSSIVREVSRFGGDVSDLVPGCVDCALKERSGGAVEDPG